MSSRDSLLIYAQRPMRYTFSKFLFFALVLPFVSSCTDQISVDPVTSANGMTFIATRIPVQEDLITAEDIVDANTKSDLFECSASKVLEQMAREYTER